MKTDGKTCPHCGEPVTYRQNLAGRYIPCAPSSASRVQLRAPEGDAPLAVVVDTGGAVFRGYVTPEGDREAWIMHTPICTEWRPPAPKEPEVPFWRRKSRSIRRRG